MLSWNLPATLPLGSLPLAIVASSPWQREQVAFDVGMVRPRCRVLRLQDVVRPVAVGAGRGDFVAALARLAVDGRRVFLDRLLVAGRAVDGLELLRVRDLLCGHVGVASGAFELQTAVDRRGELRGVDRNRISLRALGVLVPVTHETGIGDAGCRWGCRFRRRLHDGARRQPGDQDRTYRSDCNHGKFGPRIHVAGQTPRQTKIRSRAAIAA